MISATTFHRGGIRLALPFVTTIMAIFLDAMPLPHAGPTVTAPFLTLCVVFFWLVHRPNLMNPPIIFLCTLLLDAWTHMPLGLTGLVFLLARVILLPKDRFLASSSFVVVWACFALAAACVSGFRYVLASYWWDRLLSLGPVVMEWFITLLAYPFVAYLLAIVLRQLPRLRHATGS